MIPEGVPENVQRGLLRATIIGPPAVYLASDASRDLTGQRLVATAWRADQPDERYAAAGIADD